MKKRILSLCMMLAVVLWCSACGGGGTASGDAGSGDGGAPSQAADGEYALLISHLTTEEDSMHIGALYLKDLLEERSGGRITVEIFPNKVLANSDNEMIEQVRNNTVNMCITPNYIVASLNSDLKHPNIFDYPYMFQSPQEFYAFCDDALGQALNAEILQMTGIRTYGPYVPSWYKIGTTRYPINTMSDLRGLKLRTTTAEIGMATIEAFGASPTPINFGEVFTALQQGTVVGANMAGNLFVTERYYEVIKEMVATNHVGHVLYPLLNDDWFQSLPEDLRQITEECMLDYLAWIRDYGNQVEEDTIRELIELGVNVKLLDDAERQEYIGAAMPVWSDKAEVAGGQEYIDQVQAFLEAYRAG